MDNIGLGKIEFGPAMGDGEQTGSLDSSQVVTQLELRVDTKQLAYQVGWALGRERLLFYIGWLEGCLGNLDLLRRMEQVAEFRKRLKAEMPERRREAGLEAIKDLSIQEGEK